VSGTEIIPVHWSFPRERKNDEGLTIEPIKGQSKIVCTMIRSAAIIIKSAIPNDGGLQAQLLTAVNKYASAVTLVGHHRQLREDEMEAFQDDANSFFELRVELFGIEGARPL
jgi:hypothetical protein